MFDEILVDIIIMKEIYTPLCEKPILLVNKAALNYAKLGFPVHGQFSGYINARPLANIKVGYLLHKVYDHPELIDESFVSVGDYDEPLFIKVPCGHCDVCREKKRNDIVFRAAMETALYPCPPMFITLTYDNAHLPYTMVGNKKFHHGNLQYSDVQKFFKRLRKRWDNIGLKHNIRYLVSGEYGSRFGRPHYHIILWNNPYGADESNPLLMYKLRQDILYTWCMGMIDFGQCRGGAAPYAAKYVSKPCNLHGHIVKPFLHTSRGSGGLGSRMIDCHCTYLRNNPTLRELTFRSYDGELMNVGFSNYITSKVWPSPSRLIPARLRSAYRELVQLLTFSAQLGIISVDDAVRYDADLRPCSDVLPSALNIIDCLRNPDYYPSKLRLQNTYIPRFNKLFAEFADILSESFTIDSQYIALYFAYKQLQPSASNVSIANKKFSINKRLGMLQDKEVL